MTVKGGARGGEATGLRIAIAPGPECPKCHTDGFDDWWHDPTTKSGDGLVVSMTARLKCHGCGRFFSATRYADGKTHSTMILRTTAKREGAAK